jgi:hypothetical protein
MIYCLNLSTCNQVIENLSDTAQPEEPDTNNGHETSSTEIIELMAAGRTVTFWTLNGNKAVNMFMGPTFNL